MNLKLSEAIRNGAKLRPPSERGWAEVDENGIAKTCALTAACEFAGLMYFDGKQWRLGTGKLSVQQALVDERTGEKMRSESFSMEIPAEWMKVTGEIEIPPCPCKVHHVRSLVMEIIWHLHDIHHWSREAVAEWIETLEEKIAKREAAERKVNARESKKNETATAEGALR